MTGSDSMNSIDELLLAEATKVDFKMALEEKKPKSWLKSISAFANGIGGSLVYGVEDETKEITGIEDIQALGEKISKLIENHIVPLPSFELIPYNFKGKKLLEVKVKPGNDTPYYVEFGGVKEAFVRNGNDSLKAPDHMLHELILKGTHQSFDAVVTKALKSDYSFTLFEATYRERTGKNIELSDYISFGMATEKGYLTNAGKLLADQHIVFNSRIFCTRWVGIDKGSIFDDVKDDKEFEGNLIFLKKSAEDFVKNNSRVRFQKKATYRLDKPDYAERAITEAIVNALIHRSYIFPGSEIHIDMYDDRIEIVSPGGMPDGSNIADKDIYHIASERRNPVLADIFHRMRFMERRGSGLKDIVGETSRLPGYLETDKPEFYSTNNSFRVVIKNVNYKFEGDTANTGSFNDPVNGPVNEPVKLTVKEQKIIKLIMNNPNITRKEMSETMECSLSTVKRTIASLEEKQILEREGSDKTGIWIIHTHVPYDFLEISE